MTHTADMSACCHGQNHHQHHFIIIKLSAKWKFDWGSPALRSQAICIWMHKRMPAIEKDMSSADQQSPCCSTHKMGCCEQWALGTPACTYVVHAMSKPELGLCSHCNAACNAFASKCRCKCAERLVPGEATSQQICAELVNNLGASQFLNGNTRKKNCRSLLLLLPAALGISMMKSQPIMKTKNS